MIFGRDNSERARKEQAKRLKMIAGVKRFAFLPNTLEDGRYVWLQTYYTYYHGQEHKGDLTIIDYGRDTYSPRYYNHLKEDWRHIRFDIYDKDGNSCEAGPVEKKSLWLRAQSTRG